jgi:hypothetical protein
MRERENELYSLAGLVEVIAGTAINTKKFLPIGYERNC